jgi:eukaryotic-like serine/threonine-protein kinase
MRSVRETECACAACAATLSRAASRGQCIFVVVAVSPANSARVSSVAERFRLIRELGSGSVPVWAALDLQANARVRLVVVERLSRGGHYRDAEIDDWARDARHLSTLEHPNVARTREVDVRGADTLVVSDFIDGVRWSELGSRTTPVPLDVSLRVLVDVLGGLWAIHNLRDADRRPLKLVHGELTPQNVVVGFDGISKVVGLHRVRTATAGPGAAASAYLAPEVLRAEESADARADVFSVGAMLWEALSGKALFAGIPASAIAAQVSGGGVPRATLPENSAWAAPLVDIAARALAADPANRFASTAAFATELRRVGGPKLAQRMRVEALVRATNGDTIRGRREALERGEGAREVSAVEAVEAVAPHAGRYPSIPIDVEIDDGDGGTAPTPVPPLPPARPQPAPPVAAPPPVAPPPLPPPLPPPRTPAATAGFAWPSPLQARPPPAPPRIAPALSPLPAGLGFAVEDAPTEPLGLEPALEPALESVPPSAPPLASTSPDALPRRRRPRAALVVAVGLSVLAAPALLWWIASSPHRVGREASPGPAASSTLAPASSSSAPAPPAAEPSAPPVAAPAPSAAVTPDEPSSDADADTATATIPTTAAPSASAVGPAPDSPAWMTAPTPRPVAKKKYEPEGI